VDNDDMPVTVLSQITDVLELHNKTIADLRNSIELLVQENAELKKRVGALEADASLDSSDVKIITGVATRLAAIKMTPIDAKS
jgi:hypothetical protein